MKRLLSAVAALPFLAGVALAGQPVQLSDAQMDGVTAGFDFFERDVSNTSTITVWINRPAAPVAADSYLAIFGTSYSGPPPLQSFQIQSQFGPSGG
ncbi:MAG: hypothetical protein WA633_05615 [Stellaceae bacterium]